jgi:hypothetical protein
LRKIFTEQRDRGYRSDVSADLASIVNFLLIRLLRFLEIARDGKFIVAIRIGERSPQMAVNMANDTLGFRGSSKRAGNSTVNARPRNFTGIRIIS